MWPQWAAPHLGAKSYSGKRVEGFIVKTKKTQTISKEIKHRPGHTAAKRIRAVCETCNNTWMSAIESDVKGIATSMMLGENLDLTTHMQTTLAEWATLKIMVGENNRPNEAVFPQEDRDAFRRNRTIPSCLRIWVGRCMSGVWRAAYLRNAALLGFDPKVVPNGGRKNVQTTTIGIGELFIYSMACVTEGIDLNNFISIGNSLVPLWPISGSRLIWPPMRIVSVEDATRLAFVLDELIQNPNVLWHPTT
jgi:hypothetical protein